MSSVKTLATKWKKRNWRNFSSLFTEDIKDYIKSQARIIGVQGSVTLAILIMFIAVFSPILTGTFDDEHDSIKIGLENGTETEEIILRTAYRQKYMDLFWFPESGKHEIELQMNGIKAVNNSTYVNISPTFDIYKKKVKFSRNCDVDFNSTPLHLTNFSGEECSLEIQFYNRNGSYPRGTFEASFPDSSRNTLQVLYLDSWYECTIKCVSVKNASKSHGIAHGFNEIEIKPIKSSVKVDLMMNFDAPAVFKNNFYLILLSIIAGMLIEKISSFIWATKSG